MMPLGTKAPSFNLKDVVSGEQVRITDIKGDKGLVVMFICNHCPYVIHVQQELTKVADEYQRQGVGFVAISSNDVSKYPDDSPEHMKVQASRVGFHFPYLYDETQAVARAYRAKCTPDLYVFNQNRECVYRGRLDEATPGNNKSVNGKDLRAALHALVNDLPVSDEQHPSMGCNIKWR